MKYGLLGEHLSHSFSKEIHKKIGNSDYILKEVSGDDFPRFMTEKKFSGINVTIPYKVNVMPFLDHIDKNAEDIGAVNTVVSRAGTLYGYNTDFDGMKDLMIKTGLDPEGVKVLILGTGGTSRTAAAVSAAMGASAVLKVSRRDRPGSITYDEAYRYHKDASILINTTPCGMYPDICGSAADPARFPQLQGVIDAVYNPLRTEFVLKAQSLGLKASGGLYMLVSQAVHASEHFTVKKYDPNITDMIYSDILHEKENIVLTGMPGCGKTTAGTMIAEMLEREIFDTDSLITERYGMTPAQIISSEGIGAFREKESCVIRDISSRTGCVISTGGGAVLDRRNVDSLRKNGRIFFIDRPISAIVPTSDRPLSSNTDDLAALYHERYDIYRSAADDTVGNTGSISELADSIISLFKEAG